jgi:hypothetical protein
MQVSRGAVVQVRPNPWILALLTGALLVGGCALDTGEAEPTQEEEQPFDASVFRFTPITPGGPTGARVTSP